MTDVSPSVGPMWFRVTLPGIAIVVIESFFALALALHPGEGFSASVSAGLVLMGVLAAILVGAGLALGARTRFQWRGWEAQAARRSEAADEAVDRAFAPVRRWAGERPPKAKAK